MLYLGGELLRNIKLKFKLKKIFTKPRNPFILSDRIGRERCVLLKFIF